MKLPTWIATATLGLVIALPTAAQAHGQYLQGISDTVTAEIAAPACSLPGTTCGLCHQPLEGDRLENVVVGFEEIDTMDRNGPFYDTLTGEGGWDHLPHMMDGNAHRDMNLAALLDEVLPAVLASEEDSDGDGVPDLEELSLGYNPLLAYEDGDPGRSQLCKGALPFPDVGGSGSTGGGGESTGGGEDSGTDGGTGDPDPDTGAGNEGSDGPPPGGEDTGGATSNGSGGTGTGTDGGTGASDDGGGGGCRVASSTDSGALALLALLGWVTRRRRRE